MSAAFPSAQETTATTGGSRVNRGARFGIRAFALLLLIGSGLWAYDAAVIFTDPLKVWMGWLFSAALLFGAVKYWRAV
jgi:hypothetical protein